MPKVSVIIPTYNREDFMAEAVQSVLDQTFQDFEIIVVDDGSTDNTKKLLEQIGDHRIIYVNQENRGSPAARNKGIIISKGGYIAFLDSDDIWLPENLEIKVKLLDERPDIALVCSDLDVFDNESGEIIGSYWHGYESYFDLDKALENPVQQIMSRGLFISQCASLVKRPVFNEVGYYDETLLSFQDWDLFVRILKRFPIHYLDIPLVQVRKHATNIQTDLEKLHHGEVLAISKAINHYGLSKNELKLAKRRLARSYYWYGWEKTRQADDISTARRSLLTSIKIDPRNFKPYLLLAFTLLGSSGISVLKSWRKAVKRWLSRKALKDNT
jgi:glycosyltransferase involved in cell wall biosynthesis